MTDSQAAETLFQQATTLEAQGHIEAAEAAYRQVLQSHPAHAACLHALGLIAARQGDTPRAITFVRQALDAQPGDADLHNSLGTFLAASGEKTAAIAAFQAALAIDDALPMTHANLGSVLRDLGETEAALACFHRAVELAPERAGLHATLGTALQQAGRINDALHSFDRAAELRPDIAFLHLSRGNLLRELGHPAQALHAYDQALAIDPLSSVAHTNRGLTLHDLGRLHDALESLDRALALAPQLAAAHFNRANLLRDLGRQEQALAAFDQVLAIDADNVGALVNRGAVLNALDRFDEALASVERALALSPNHAEAINNRGNILQDLGRYNEAITAFSAALAVVPDQQDIAWNLSLAQLQQGDYATGWKLHEARKRKRSPVADLDFSVPLWLGETDLRGKKLFLRGEQGLGDTLQFCRYALLANLRGASVTLSVQTPLLRLLRQLGPTIDVIDYDLRPAKLDLHAPLMSLPLAFGTTLDTIPTPGGYLRAADADWSRWLGVLGEKKRPRIGLVWSGNPAHHNDRHRSVGLRAILPLLDFDAEFISLQADVRPEDQPVLRAVSEIRHFDGKFHDFADTAGLIATVDLVITVDTATAHLAAAMGKPTWIMLPFNPDWRWLLGRDESPWYRSVRLFRTEGPAGRDAMIAKVRAALDE